MRDAWGKADVVRVSVAWRVERGEADVGSGDGGNERNDRNERRGSGGGRIGSGGGCMMGMRVYAREREGETGDVRCEM